MELSLLKVVDLKTYFFTLNGVVKAVDGVSFEIQNREILGIVGESGAGKSITSLSIMRLIPKPAGRIVAGEIFFRGEDILKRTDREMQKIRGNEISMIFQEPNAALNPVMKVGFQIAESIAKVKNKKIGKEVYAEVRRMLEIAGLDWERTINLYPHELSGGMAQRVMIAMALSSNPKLLIADEPTSALDVTIEAQILYLIQELQKEFDMSVMIITHDLGVISEICDRVIVMYAGKIMETAKVHTLFKKPLHPYTIGLLNSVLNLQKEYTDLKSIHGTVPDMNNLPKGCSFHPRCFLADKKCKEDDPPIKIITTEHSVRCWNYELLRQNPALRGGN